MSKLNRSWVAVVCALSVGVAASCANTDATPRNRQLVAAVGQACQGTAEDCACKTIGETAACGIKKDVGADYVLCELGSRTCEANSAWGACVPAGPTSKVSSTHMYAGNGISLLGLAAPTNCNSPCDPRCIQYVDDPIGLDAGTGVVATEAGVSLQSSGAADTCTTLSVVPALVRNDAPKTPIVAPYGLNAAKDTLQPALVVTELSPSSGQVVRINGQTSANPPLLRAKLGPFGCTGAADPEDSSYYVPVSWSVDAANRKDVLAVGQDTLRPGNDGPTYGLLQLARGIADDIVVHADTRRGTTILGATLKVPVRVKVVSVDGPRLAGGFNPWVLAGGTAPLPATFVPTGLEPADPASITYPTGGEYLPLGMPAPTVQWQFSGSQPTTSGSIVTQRFATNSSADKSGVSDGVMLTLSYGTTFEWSVIFPEPCLHDAANCGRPRGQRVYRNLNVAWRVDGVTGAAVATGGEDPNVIPPAIWRAFEQTTRGNNGTITVRRRVGGVLRQAMPAKVVSFGTETLGGHVYYTDYAINNGWPKQMLLDPSHGQPADSIYGAAYVGNFCPVCHSVSGNGRVYTTSSRQHQGVMQGGIAGIDAVSGIVTAPPSIVNTRTWYVDDVGSYPYPRGSGDDSLDGPLVGAETVASRMARSDFGLTSANVSTNFSDGACRGLQTGFGGAWRGLTGYSWKPWDMLSGCNGSAVNEQARYRNAISSEAAGLAFAGLSYDGQYALVGNANSGNTWAGWAGVPNTGPAPELLIKNLNGGYQSYGNNSSDNTPMASWTSPTTTNPRFDASDWRGARWLDGAGTEKFSRWDGTPYRLIRFALDASGGLTHYTNATAAAIGHPECETRSWCNVSADPAGAGLADVVLNTPSWAPLTGTLSRVVAVAGGPNGKASDPQANTAWRRGLVVMDFSSTSGFGTPKVIYNTWNPASTGMPGPTGSGWKDPNWPSWEPGSQTVVAAECTGSCLLPAQTFCAVVDAAQNITSVQCYDTSGNLGTCDSTRTSSAVASDKCPGVGAVKIEHGMSASAVNSLADMRLFSISASETTPSAPTTLNYLANAEGGSKRNYGPSFFPHVRGGKRWMIFTSARAYGNTSNVRDESFEGGFCDSSNNPITANQGKSLQSLLWVAAVDDDESSSSSGDRSHKAFLLPNQSMSTRCGNHAFNERPIWTEEACTPLESSCESDSDCCGYDDAVVANRTECVLDQRPSVGAVCRKKTSVCPRPAVPVTVPECYTDGDCCNLGTVCRSDGTNPAKCVAPPCSTTYATGQTFSRTFEAKCGTDQTPTWTSYQYNYDTPAGTTIVFEVRAASTAAGLATATWMPLATASGASKTDPLNPAIAVTTTALGSADSQKSFIEVRARLNASADQCATPSLIKWTQSYTCKDSG